ncbi:MAG TPA: aminopeptidase [Candidatus Merdicola faecigallinarum]|uniref:M18 family aminopeptidase n=1 Tax=Candidatus Merdicola faecigallinarum TaxID=2840862 RepID=A0A9D1M0S5_9FIRM|nr:aminopeptidase [Candidatus Merdicola faecigallinarum]
MEKTEGQLLQEKLFDEKKNGWEKISQEIGEKIFEYAKGYMKFLNQAKTEREIVTESEKIAKENGFKNVEECETLQPGDKVYYNNRAKSLYLAVIGKENLRQGINMIGAHGDSPRLDLKPNPLCEDTELAFFKTHYYGGIKKYQWTTIPLAIHGVMIKKNGEKITIRIGEEEDDPIFTITDLLPHLAQEQMEKKLKSGVAGEDLKLLVGSIPYNDEKVKEKVKLNLLNILNRKYGITEADFMSSELELVPAFKAKSLGFDESLIAAYGQDDKVSVYTSLTALMNIENPNKTAICMITDKEEIGSMGNTGMESHVFDYFVTILLNKLNLKEPNMLEEVFCHSRMLSADVDAGYDPIYNSVYEKGNASYLNHGIGINKYSGSRGKAGGSDANAEFVAEVRSLLEEKEIGYQLAELGKVDVGGGGTIAYILANKGVNVIDAGVPVLSMHAPYEVTSKYDVYQAYLAYEAFWNE